MREGYVYIMANRKNGTLYLGVTNDLVRRAEEHRQGQIEGFTKKHGCTRQVWYEAFGDLHQARLVEVQMKKWKRAWKVRAIEELNKDWDDLWWRIGRWPDLSVPCEGRGPSPDGPRRAAGSIMGEVSRWAPAFAGDRKRQSVGQSE